MGPDISPNHTVDWYTLSWLLVGDLRTTLDEPLTEESLAWMEPVLDTLITSLKHCDAENVANQEILEMLAGAASWQSHVAALHQERRDVIEILEELSLRIDWNLPVDKLANDVGTLLGYWMGRMLVLQLHEHELVQESYYWETGVPQ